jgi:mRNA-degrading endonuclease RelE of RelBE toxin-antitoxin system
MARYQVEVTEEAKVDLSSYNAYEEKTIADAVRAQLTDQPTVATRNRKQLRDNPIGQWELRIDKFRVFYEVQEDTQMVTVVAVGHKEHATLFIRGVRVKL